MTAALGNTDIDGVDPRYNIAAQLAEHHTSQGCAAQAGAASTTSSSRAAAALTAEAQAAAVHQSKPAATTAGVINHLTSPVYGDKRCLGPNKQIAHLHLIDAPISLLPIRIQIRRHHQSWMTDIMDS